MLNTILNVVFYICFWAAFLGFCFIGMGAKTGDTDLIFFGLPYALIGALLTVISYKILKTTEA